MGYTLKQAVMAGFQRYALFTGRAQRSEYWYWVLFCFLVGLVLSILGGILLDSDILSLLFNLAVLVPSIAVAIRRMHDTNKSGWWVLINLIPFLGTIVFIYLAVQPSDQGPNQYGEAPLAPPVV